MVEPQIREARLEKQEVIALGYGCKASAVRRRPGAVQHPFPAVGSTEWPRKHVRGAIYYELIMSDHLKASTAQSSIEP